LTYPSNCVVFTLNFYSIIVRHVEASSDIRAYIVVLDSIISSRNIKSIVIIPGNQIPSPLGASPNRRPDCRFELDPIAAIGDFPVALGIGSDIVPLNGEIAGAI